MAEPRTSPGRRFLSTLGMLAVIVLIVVAAAGIYLVIHFTRDQAVQYQDNNEHFKYGSLGSEHTFGIPYWIWRALPELFADKLPLPRNGWQSVGFVFEKNTLLPMAMSEGRYSGYALVCLNCAFCRAVTVRKKPEPAEGDVE